MDNCQKKTITFQDEVIDVSCIIGTKRVEYKWRKRFVVICRPFSLYGLKKDWREKGIDRSTLVSGPDDEMRENMYSLCKWNEIYVGTRL